MLQCHTRYVLHYDQKRALMLADLPPSSQKIETVINIHVVDQVGIGRPVEEHKHTGCIWLVVTGQDVTAVGVRSSDRYRRTSDIV
jgi:hypothetical protein